MQLCLNHPGPVSSPSFTLLSEPVTETPTVDGRRDALPLTVVRVPTVSIWQNASLYVSLQVSLVWFGQSESRTTREVVAHAFKSQHSGGKASQI